MFRSRLIRIVVNLSLIVVMMIQPGMALIFANDCGAKSASGLMCEGCGCCEVASPEEKCCCCGGEQIAGDKSCCMGEDESNDSWESASTETPSLMAQSVETLELKVIVISTTEPSDTVDCNANLNAVPADVEVSSSCGCGIDSVPLGESAPARPTISPRDSVAIRHADLIDLFGGSTFPRPRCRDFGGVSSPPHFSQIQFGIWRL